VTIRLKKYGYGWLGFVHQSNGLSFVFFVEESSGRMFLGKYLMNRRINHTAQGIEIQIVFVLTEGFFGVLCRDFQPQHEVTDHRCQRHGPPGKLMFIRRGQPQVSPDG
jgi:hypothetical protein